VTVSDVIVTRKIDLSFAVRVNRVLLNAVVTDKDGRFVRGLGPADLTVKEEGSVRPIMEFSLETRPLSVALVLDTSGSMQERIEDARKGASAFVDSLAPEDKALVVDFADKVFLLQPMTDDRDALRQAIGSISAVGATAIYDAVHATLREMRAVEGRKALILLSDGADTDSQFPRERVIEEAKAADVALYTIGLGAGGTDLSARGLLKEFSEATGGQAIFIKDAAELTTVFARITDDLRNQYYLTYESANETYDGRWVPIEVRTRNSDYSVRARSGYFAARREP
jgi:Ca-activated chloride channel family protein